ncbi:MAG: gamma-glutamyl-gamma-aminobutyrate hydrolase family protein [Clostridiales bacterium]
MKPIIGIVFHRKVRDNYGRAIINAGGIPVYLGVHGDVNDALPLVNALCFGGGGDVLASLFGNDFEPETGLPDVARDYYELSLIQAAYAIGMPMMGICRGMQMINIALGGTIHQDIGAKHLQKANPMAVSHEIYIKENSNLFKIVNKEKIQVNSFHHQSVASLAIGLSATAKSPHGVVEAIEGNNILAMQWHPEWLQHRDDERKIFNDFIGRAYDYSQKSGISKIK